MLRQINKALAYLSYTKMGPCLMMTNVQEVNTRNVNDFGLLKLQHCWGESLNKTATLNYSLSHKDV